MDCEIWIPAARPDVIHEGNVARLRAKLVVSGANIPTTTEAERHLHERGCSVCPDFIANAGGVICAAMEYHGATEAAAFEAIEEKIRSEHRAGARGGEAARYPSARGRPVELATERVRRAMELPALVDLSERAEPAAR